jgi:hypothetical protein
MQSDQLIRIRVTDVKLEHAFQSVDLWYSNRNQQIPRPSERKGPAHQLTDGSSPHQNVSEIVVTSAELAVNAVTK